MSIIITVLVTVVSGIFYYLAKQNIMDIQQEANRKVLSQIDYNISFMNEMIKNMAISTYLDNDMIPLLYGSQVDYVQKVKQLIRLDKLISAAPYIQSIVIYNKNMNTYLSTEYNSDEGVLKNLRNYMASEHRIVKARLLPLTSSIFSYFVCDTETCGVTQSLIVFNIRTAWLYDNIQLINQVSGNRGQIAIMDQQGALFGLSNQPISTPLDADFLMEHNPVLSGTDTFNYVNAIDNGKNYLLSYIHTINGWYVVSVQNYDEVMGGIDKFRTFVITGAIAVLLLALLIVVAVSQRLYHPIGKLFRLMKDTVGNDSQDRPDRDEFVYISSTYLQVIRNYQHTRKSFAKHHQLRMMLLDSSVVTKEQITNIIKENKLNMDPNSLYHLCLFKIDSFKSFNEDPYYSNKSLFRFAIVNITEETFSRQYRIEMVDLLEDHFVLLVSLSEGQDDGNQESGIAELLKESQSIISKLYGISLTAVISESPCSCSGLTEAYHSALNISSYRMIYGPMKVLSFSMVESNIRNETLRFPIEMEEKLSNLIRSNHHEEAKLHLDLIFSRISQFRFDNQIQNVMQLIYTIHSTVSQINQNRLNPLSIDLKSFATLILESENLSDIRHLFDEFIERIMNQLERNEDAKLNLLVDTIKNTVETEYMNESLSLQSIAAALKMSHVYLGTNFKKSVGKSVADYLNDIRLKHAVRLIEEGDRSIKDIMIMVGYTNESNFYRIFKKHYGVTPKEYRLRKTVKEY